MISALHRLSAVFGLVLLSGALFAQSGVDHMPEDIQPFWKLYYPAKVADDEADMDKAVRLHAALAEQSLELLIDDICLMDDYALHDELRTLAWSMDRVQGLTRFIERVRNVLDMDMSQRRQRRQAVTDFVEALDLVDEAKVELSEDAWKASLSKFEIARVGFERLGDAEWTIISLRQMCDVEVQLRRPWHRGQLLKAILVLAEVLPYKEIQGDWAEFELTKLRAAGIDPDGPEPAAATPGAIGAAPDGAASEGGGGRGISSYASGSSDQVFAFKQSVPKKGIGSVALPSLSPIDQFLTWPFTYVEDDGPSEFNADRPLSMQPFGVALMLTRDGTEFGIDANGDGEPDVLFAPSSNPQRVDIPSPDGEQVYPLLLSVPGDREQMFGMELNYSPQPGGARLRFGLACLMQGKVLGSTWKLYDSNLTGRYGDSVEFWDDLLGEFEEDEQTYFFDHDSVLVGKAKKAVPWSSILPVGDGFYRASINPEGTQLTLREMNLQTGFVKLDAKTAVPPSFAIIREVGKLEGAYFDVAPLKRRGVIEVPVGTYQFDTGMITKGKKTSMQQARMIRGRAEPFEVKAGETHVLELGAPYTLRPVTRNDGKTLVVEGHKLRVWGRGGEEYRYLFDEVLRPTVEARTAEGKKLGKPERMRPAGITEWQTLPSYTIWFPLDLRIDNKGGDRVQVRMSVKSHPLLGGPFESDWTP